MTEQSNTPLVDADEARQRAQYANDRECDWPAFPSDFDLARRLETALREIARYDEEPIWQDDRDDAADAILAIARKALGEE